MKKNTLENKSPVLLIAAMLLCAAVCAVLFVYLDGYTAYDVKGHWKICRYTLEGLNPYPLIGQPAAIESIGAIPAAFSTVPWSCVFGSAFYAGFLPLEAARAYVFVMHFVAVAVLLLVIYNKYKGVLSKKQLAVLLLVPPVHFSFMYSLHFGNAGGIICCMLMTAFLIGKKHSYIAGVLLGFAMMKPQIAAIICLVFLFEKRFKTLFTAAGIVIAGWAATSLATAVNPIDLLKYTLESGTAASTQYLGLLNNLKYFGVSSTLILLMNVAIGCVYTLGLYIYLKKRARVDSVFIFVPACIASVFWIYKNGTDYMILAFAAAFFCLLCMSKKLTAADFFASLFSVAWLQMSRCAVYLGVTFFEDNYFARDLFKSADGLIIAIVGIYLCRLWVKYGGEELVIKLKQGK
ncbi:MAG: DUF2029 domain-containing protein [Clostridia bacterium]|nr:DUF2029 domain-containing protein [Clostridia bacterium]